MARRRSDGGVEECKGYSPPNDHTTSASSIPLPLDSWDLNAGTRSTETESLRSARVAKAGLGTPCVRLETATLSNINLWLGGEVMVELKSIKVIHLLMTTRQALRQFHCLSARGI